MSAAERRTTPALTRAEPLREREGRIRDNLQTGTAAFHQVGKDLLWIRGDHLYEEAGFKT
jgi:hypothetical protein